LTFKRLFHITILNSNIKLKFHTFVLNMTKTTKNTKDTKQRVLESACSVFADKGYRDANIGEICELASANRAAVNYYFSDKEELYRQVWRYVSKTTAASIPIDGGLNTNAPPEDRFRAFIFATLNRIFDKTPAGYLPKLMVREMAEPTEIFDEIFHEIIIPQIDHLFLIIRQLLGDKVSEKLAHLAGISVMSQCMYFSFNKAIRQRHFKEGENLQKIINLLADHITHFSLAGIHELSGRCKRTTQ